MTRSQNRYTPVCLPQIFGGQRFRALYDAQDSTVYFVLNDLCALLGHSNARMAAKRHVAPQDVTKRYVLDTNGRYQRTTVVNESGLYALVFGSRLPAAGRFKHYVTSQILPSVRKYGAYMDPSRTPNDGRTDRPWPRHQRQRQWHHTNAFTYRGF